MMAFSAFQLGLCSCLCKTGHAAFPSMIASFLRAVWTPGTPVFCRFQGLVLSLKPEATLITAPVPGQVDLLQML